MVFEEDKFRGINPFPLSPSFDRIWIWETWVPIPILTSTRGNLEASLFSDHMRSCMSPLHSHNMEHPMGHLCRLNETMGVKQLASITHPTPIHHPSIIHPLPIHHHPSSTPPSIHLFTHPTIIHSSVYHSPIHPFFFYLLNVY